MTDDEQERIPLLMYQHRETPKARRMSPNSYRRHKVWLPKSQISAAITTEADVWLVYMPYWLAERAELLSFVAMEEDGKFVKDGQWLWTGARKLDLD